MSSGISAFVPPSSGIEVVNEKSILAFRETAEGARIYKRTLSFLLSAAAHQSGIQHVCVEESVGASFLIKCPPGTDAGALANVMMSLIDQDLPVSLKAIERSEAIAKFTEQAQPKSVKRVQFTPQVAVNCYSVQLKESKGSPEFICMQYGSLLPRFGLLDKSLMSLETISETTLQLFYPQLKDGQFQLSRTPEPMLMEAYAKQKVWAGKLDFQTVTDVNQAIIHSKGNMIVQLSEAMHEFQIVNIATKIGGTPGDTSSEARPRLVLIAGPSSSGKTTFAKRLCVSLETTGLKPIVISVDSYYKSWQDINPRGMEFVDWESLQSLNLELLNEHLISLLAGEEVRVPEYDMRTSMPKSEDQWVTTRLPPGGLIIMEGIHCLNPQLTPRITKADKFQIMISPLSALALDEMTFVSSTQVRMMRRMVRDYLFRGRSATSTLKQWPGVTLGETRNIFPNQNNADVVMNSGLLFEANVLKIYAEPLLRTIMPDQEEFAEAQRLLTFCDQLVSLPGNSVPPQSLLREFIGGSWFYEYGGWYKTA